MATVATLTTIIRSLLDDDLTTSNRYDLDKDIIPAMNSAIDYLVAVFSAGFESKQIKPEVLGNLIVSKPFDAVQATTGGTVAKIDITALNYNTEVWRLLGVEPNPSISQGTVIYSASRMAQRMTLEQWNHSQSDPFARGTTLSIPTDFVESSYTGPGAYYGGGSTGSITIEVVAENTYLVNDAGLRTTNDAATADVVLNSQGVGTFTRSAGSYITDGFAVGQVVTFTGFTNAGNNTSKIISAVSDLVLTTTDITGLVNETGDGDETATAADLYLLLRPYSVLDANSQVAIYYLKAPTALTLSSSTIDFPVSLHNLIVQKTIQFLSYQHSKDGKYFQVTDKEVKELITLMNM
jgi:hypothetical protein